MMRRLLLCVLPALLLLSGCAAPVDPDEARESIRAAMKLGLEAAKVKNKERFTPKKFRKE